MTFANVFKLRATATLGLGDVSDEFKENIMVLQHIGAYFFFLTLRISKTFPKCLRLYSHSSILIYQRIEM